MNPGLSTSVPAPRSLSAGSVPYLLFGFLVAVPMMIWVGVALQRVPSRAWLVVACCGLAMAAMFYWIGYYRVILTQDTVFHRTLFQTGNSIALAEIERIEWKPTAWSSVFKERRNLLIIPKGHTGKRPIVINTLFFSAKDVSNLFTHLQEKLPPQALPESVAQERGA